MFKNLIKIKDQIDVRTNVYPREEKLSKNDSIVDRHFCRLDASRRRPNEISVRATVARRRDQARKDPGKPHRAPDRADLNRASDRFQRW